MNWLALGSAVPVAELAAVFLVPGDRLDLLLASQARNRPVERLQAATQKVRHLPLRKGQIAVPLRFLLDQLKQALVDERVAPVDLGADAIERDGRDLIGRRVRRGIPRAVDSGDAGCVGCVRAGHLHGPTYDDA